MKNELQEKVINHGTGPAVVLAGAGSGKTHTLIKRIERLSNEVDPSRIVMLTFTNSAADEMKERASKVNDKCSRVIATTYHKYCGMMLRKHGKSIGLPSNFEILDTVKYRTLIEYVKSSSDRDYNSKKDFPSATKLSKIFSLKVNTGASFDDIINGEKFYDYLPDIERLYDEVCTFSFKNAKLNFDDMLIYMNKMLDIDVICRYVANSFDFLMVDEFQDTNGLQLDILKKISKFNKNIVVIGDISQSIYKFRGARVQNITEFEEHFGLCAKYTLNINYRSTQEILDPINKMMNLNCKWEYADMVSNDKHGKAPLEKHHYDEREQARWVVNVIENSKYDLKDIAIIVRKSFSSFILENALSRAKIPFIKKGGMKFTEYECVGEVLAFLSILNGKADRFNWFTVLRLMPGIGNKTAIKIAEKSNEPNFLYDYSNKKYGKDLETLDSILYEAKKITDLQELISYIAEYYFDLKTYKVENSSSSSSVKYDAMEKIDREKNVIEALKGMAVPYDNLSTFLEDIALDTLKRTVPDDECLTITTIHSAKGLEWNMVILLDPYQDTDLRGFPIHDPEELRCWYVAMTRAKEKLYISVADVINHREMQLTDYIKCIHLHRMDWAT